MRVTKVTVAAAMLIFHAAPAYGEKELDGLEAVEQGRPVASPVGPSDEELRQRLRQVIESLKGQPLGPGCLEG